MSYEYAAKKRSAQVERHTGRSTQPSLDALRSGAATPTQEQLGRRVDLPDAMRSKMETAFGADFSAVKLYESQAVADAGANAVSQGSRIAFAPGMLDFTSFGGQALLGHELSHVVSQARGEVTGSGFLNDHALEARADREGAMAAAGQQIAMPAAAMSAVTAAPAAGPMQADKTDTYRQRETEAFDKSVMAVVPAQKEAFRKEYEKFNKKKVRRLRRTGMNDEQIAADNAQTTDFLKQMERSKARNIVGHPEPEAYKRHMTELHSIIGTMSDEDMRSREDVRNEIVNSYVSARTNLGADKHGAFMDDLPADPAAAMYARMIGRDNISSALREDPDSAVYRIMRHARDSGATDLLKRQHNMSYCTDPRGTLDFNVLDEAKTMRGLWQKAIMANSAQGGSVESVQKAQAINDTLHRQMPDAAVLDHYHGRLMGISNEPQAIRDDTAGDFLIGITDQDRRYNVRMEEVEEQRRRNEAIWKKYAPPESDDESDEEYGTPVYDRSLDPVYVPPSLAALNDEVETPVTSAKPEKKKAHHHHHHHHHHGKQAGNGASSEKKDKQEKKKHHHHHHHHDKAGDDKISGEKKEQSKKKHPEKHPK